MQLSINNMYICKNSRINALRSWIWEREWERKRASEREGGERERERGRPRTQWIHPEKTRADQTDGSHLRTHQRQLVAWCIPAHVHPVERNWTGVAWSCVKLRSLHTTSLAHRCKSRWELRLQHARTKVGRGEKVKINYAGETWESETQLTREARSDVWSNHSGNILCCC